MSNPPGISKHVLLCVFDEFAEHPELPTTDDLCEMWAEMMDAGEDSQPFRVLSAALGRLLATERELASLKASQ